MESAYTKTISRKLKGKKKKTINRMEKLQNLTNRKKAQRRQIRREEEDIMYQYLSAEYCPF